MTFPRHRHVEYYTLASCIDSDPQNSSFRVGFSKISHIGTVLEDIYDTFGTMDELKLFTTEVKRLYYQWTIQSILEECKLHHSTSL